MQRSARCGIVLATAWVACASAPTPPPPAPPQPIDLSPRCEPVLEPLAPGAPLPTPRSPRVRLETLPRDVRWLSVATPAALLDALHWGFPTRGGRARLAAALLQSGEASADPRALRDALLDLGAGLLVEIEGGRLWIELRSPPAGRDAALALLSRRLQSDDETGDAPEAAAEPESEATPTDLVASLRDTLRPEGSVVLHLSPGGDDAEHVARTGIAEWIARRPVAAVDDAGPAADTSEASRTSGADAKPGAEPGTIHVIDRPDSPQVELLVGFPTVPAGHVDAPALDMLASLLGSDVGGRLFRDLRERQGLAYIIKASQEPEGGFLVSTRARPERVAALLLGIEAHLDALVELPLLPCEVGMLVDRMTGETALLADDTTQLARRWRGQLARAGEPEPLSDRVAAYRAAAERGLEAVARRHLTGPATVVLVGDAKRLRRDLGRALPGRSITIRDGDLRPTR